MSEVIQCEICGNKIGFALGTCIDCGFNYITKEFTWIRVYVEDLSDIDKDSLIAEHIKWVKRKKR